MTEATELSLNEIIGEIRTQVKRIKWTKEQVRDYLIKEYDKNGLFKLTDKELIEFATYISGLPTPSLIRIRKVKVRSIPKSTKDLKAEIEPPIRF